MAVVKSNLALVLRSYDLTLANYIYSLKTDDGDNMRVLVASPHLAFSQMKDRYGTLDRVPLPHSSISRVWGPQIDFSRFTTSFGPMLRHLEYVDDTKSEIKTSALPVPINMLYHVEFWATGEWDLASTVMQMQLEEGMVGVIYRKVNMGGIWGEKFVPFFPGQPVDNSDLIGGSDHNITLRWTVPFICRGYIPPDIVTKKTVKTGKIDFKDLTDDTLVESWVYTPPET